jgi:hypothetical protein
LPAWIKEGYATEKTGTIVWKGDFTNFQPQLFKTKEQVLENIQTKEALLVDALPIVSCRNKSHELDWEVDIQFNKYSLYATTERRKIFT